MECIDEQEKKDVMLKCNEVLVLLAICIKLTLTYMF